MPELLALVRMPLAQMNSTTAPGAGGIVPVPPTPAPHAEAPAIQGPAAPAIGGPAGGAATTSQPGALTPEAQPKPPPHWYDTLGGMLPIILIFVALYLFLFRGQKKEEKRRKALLSEMKKGDKVQTVGGLVARVISIDNDDVVLKIDESANVRAVYKKSAILNVIVPSDEKTK